MLMLYGVTSNECAAVFTAFCSTCTWGGWPTRLAASRPAPVICHSVDGPPVRAPLTFRSNLCGVSVAFTTANSRNLRSGDSAANMSSGYVGLPEFSLGWSPPGGYFGAGCGELPVSATGIEPTKCSPYNLNRSPVVFIVAATGL